MHEMFQTFTIASSGLGTEIVLCIPCKDMASCLFFACHAITKGRGFHILWCGPTMLMNISDELREIVICEHSDVQNSVYFAKAPHTSRLLTGAVSTALRSF